MYKKRIKRYFKEKDNDINIKKKENKEITKVNIKIKEELKDYYQWKDDIFIQKAIFAHQYCLKQFGINIWLNCFLYIFLLFIFDAITLSDLCLMGNLIKNYPIIYNWMKSLFIIRSPRLW